MGIIHELGGKWPFGTPDKVICMPSPAVMFLRAPVREKFASSTEG
jgi:hypothetical protein